MKVFNMFITAVCFIFLIKMRFVFKENESKKNEFLTSHLSAVLSNEWDVLFVR